MLRCLEGIDPSDVRGVRPSTDLLLTVWGICEVIGVSGYFFNDRAGSYVLNTIEFADGTVWDIDTMKSLVQRGGEDADLLC